MMVLWKEEDTPNAAMLLHTGKWADHPYLLSYNNEKRLKGWNTFLNVAAAIQCGLLCKTIVSAIIAIVGFDIMLSIFEYVMLCYIPYKKSKEYTLKDYVEIEKQLIAMKMELKAAIDEGRGNRKERKRLWEKKDEVVNMLAATKVRIYELNQEVNKQAQTVEMKDDVSEAEKELLPKFENKISYYRNAKEKIKEMADNNRPYLYPVYIALKNLVEVLDEKPNAIKEIPYKIQLHLNELDAVIQETNDLIDSKKYDDEIATVAVGLNRAITEAINKLSEKTEESIEVRLNVLNDELCGDMDQNDIDETMEESMAILQKEYNHLNKNTQNIKMAANHKYNYVPKKGINVSDPQFEQEVMKYL